MKKAIKFDENGVFTKDVSGQPRPLVLFDNNPLIWEGLQSYYNFTETGYYKSVRDIKGTSHGTMYNNASYVTGGIRTNSMQVNTLVESDILDKFRLPVANPTPSSEFTLSLWVRFHYPSGYIIPSMAKTIVAGFNYIPDISMDIMNIRLSHHGYFTNGNFNLIITKTDGYAFNVASSSMSVTQNQWHHLVISYNRYETFGLKLYFDNQVIIQRNPDQKMIIIPEKIDFGTENTGTVINPNWQYTRAKFDEIGLWRRALSAEEVQYLYNSRTGRFYP